MGRYLIYEQISRGAFGIVYAAFDPDLDRKVAIKVVRDQGGETEGQQGISVLMEAQATAQITHPNVVAIYDVGRVDAESAALLTGERDGEYVFLVMEFLAGDTLRQWMREHKEDVERTVDVFRQAAAGLKAAHDRQLMHLDFKPSNAMFSSDGGLRVLDFGLARVVRHNLQVSRISTGHMGSTGPTAGTPPYMAPEQHAAGVADERADQYSFCVALYEALLGQRPFLATDTDELLEQKKKGIAPGATAKLPRYLRQILWRGLSPNPSARFGSMGELLDAIDHGRGAKRRKQLALVAVAGSLTLLLAGTVLGGEAAETDACAAEREFPADVWSADIAESARAAFVAGHADMGAESWAATERGIEAFAESWTRSRVQACEDTLLEGTADAELMNQRMLCLDRGLHQLSGLTTLFQAADASVVRVAPASVSSLGDPQSCIRRLVPRSANSETTAAEDRETKAKAEADLARALLLGEASRTDEALALVQDVRDRIGTVDPSFTARVAFTEAKILYIGVRYADTVEKAKSALTLAERAAETELTVEAKLLLAKTLARTGRKDEAAIVGELVLAHVLANYPGTTLEAKALSALAVVQFRREAYDEARSYNEREIELLTKLHGEDHPDLALAHNNLANAHLSRGGDLDFCEQHYRRAIELWTRAFGPRYWRVGGSHNNIAIVLSRRGDLPGAIAEYRKAEEILMAAHPGGHPYLANVLSNQSGIAVDLGQFSLGFALANRALAMRHQVGIKDVGSDAQSKMTAARLLAEVGRDDEARKWEAEAHALAQEAYGDDEWKRAVFRLTHFDMLTALERWEELEQLLPRFERAVAQHREDPDHGKRRSAFLHARARVHVERERFREAIADLDEAAQRDFDQDDQLSLAISGPLVRARALEGLGDPQGALDLCRDTISYIESKLSPKHPWLARAYTCAGRILRAQGKTEAAATYFERASKIAAGKDASPRLRAWVETRTAPTTD